MRIILSFFARKIFRNQFLLLKVRLLIAYYRIDYTQTKERFSIIEKFLISGEDHRFLYHIGFDPIAIIRAFRNSLLFGKREGGSTIEQQVVRVLINDFQRSIKRKIKELLLATTLNEIIPRDAIPLVYLHIAYYGTKFDTTHKLMTRFKINDLCSVDEEIAGEIVARIKYPEPRFASIQKIQQIQIRKEHLINLYHKHKERKWIKIYG